MIKKENFEKEIRLHRVIYFDHRVTSQCSEIKFFISARDRQKNEYIKIRKYYK